MILFREGYARIPCLLQTNRAGQRPILDFGDALQKRRDLGSMRYDEEFYGHKIFYRFDDPASPLNWRSYER